MSPKKKKRACPFSSSTPRRKKLAESDKGSYYNQEKWLKDDKASGKLIKTTTEFYPGSFRAFEPQTVDIAFLK